MASSVSSVLICSARLRGQAILQIVRRERRRQLAQIGSGCADLARQLAEAPMSRRYRRVGSGQDQRQSLGIVPVRLDEDKGALDDASPAALGPAAHGAGQIAEREEPVVIGPREPLRRNPPDPDTSTL